MTYSVSTSESERKYSFSDRTVYFDAILIDPFTLFAIFVDPCPTLRMLVTSGVRPKHLIYREVAHPCDAV